MSLKRTAIEFLQCLDIGRSRGHSRVPEAIPAALSVVAAVAIGGVLAGMAFTDMLICGLVAGCGVALFCAVAGRLFDGRLGHVGSGSGTRRASERRHPSLDDMSPISPPSA